MAVYDAKQNLRISNGIPGQKALHIYRPESTLRKTQDRWRDHASDVRAYCIRPQIGVKSKLGRIAPDNTT